MTAASQIPKAPAGMGVRGRALWRQVQATYELDPVEQAVLARLCVAVDRAERIRAELADQPLLTRGSAGQPRSSPLLMAAEQADRTVDRLAGSLGVSMPDVGKPRAHQSKAQKTRWSRAAKSASVTPIKGA